MSAFTIDWASILTYIGYPLSSIGFALFSKYFLTQKNEMKTKITKRDLTAFILGVVVMILISFFSDFKNNVQSFMDGFNETYHNDR